MTESKSRGLKEARIQRILAGLSAREREALYRFYTLKQDSLQISRELGFSEDELRKLRARVKQEFIAAGSAH